MSSVKDDLTKFLRNLKGEQTGPSLKTTPEKATPKKPKIDIWTCPRCGWSGKAARGIMFKASSITGTFENAGREYRVCGGTERCGPRFVTDALPAESITKYAVFYSKKLWAVAEAAAKCGTCGDKQSGNRKRSLEDGDSSPPKRAKTAPKKEATTPVAGSSKKKTKIASSSATSSSPVQGSSKSKIIVIPDTDDEAVADEPVPVPDYFSDSAFSVEA